MPETTLRAQKDLARSWLALLLWGPPLIAFLATAPANLPSPTRGIVWSLALLWAGVACIANASRSGRVHWHITGPFFLLLAVASYMHGVGIAPLGPHGWLWIGGVLAVGAPLLTVLPERIWGQYSSRSDRCC